MDINVDNNSKRLGPPRRIKLLSREAITLYHTLLIGASPLIPLPFLDELVVTYLRRHLVAEIAKSHNIKLAKLEIRQLADPPSAGCLGFLGAILIRPLKELFRELFFWLEWKRGIDLATQAYYSGYLLNVILERGDFIPQEAPRYRLAIQNTLRGINTKLVRNMIGKTFYSSKGLVMGVTGWLFQFGKYYVRLAFRFVWKKPGQFFRWLRRKKTSDPTAPTYDRELNDYFQDTQPRITDLISVLLESMAKGIGSLPKEHFDELINKLNLELQRPPEAAKVN